MRSVSMPRNIKTQILPNSWDNANIKEPCRFKWQTNTYSVVRGGVSMCTTRQCHTNVKTNGPRTPFVPLAHRDSAACRTDHTLSDHWLTCSWSNSFSSRCRRRIDKKVNGLHRPDLRQILTGKIVHVYYIDLDSSFVYFGRLFVVCNLI